MHRNRRRLNRPLPGCGTGFSRESVRWRAAKLRVNARPSSLLKPVLPSMRAFRSIACAANCGTGFSRESVRWRAAKLWVSARASSRLKPVLPSMRAFRSIACAANCGTGFSRESIRWRAAKLRVNARASSRLKPVPLKSIACIQKYRVRRKIVGPGLAGKASGGALQD